MITEKGKPKQLIQVCNDMKNPKVKEREVNPLINAANQLKIKECIILTEDQKTEFSEGKLKIKVLPLWHWLLGLT